MNDRIAQLIKGHSNGNLSEFSRESGVPYGSLYDLVRGKSDLDKVSIGYFMKIAHCLGMTADELYYGTAPERPRFDDPRQEAVNGHYESLNETGRQLVAEAVEAMSSSPALRAVKYGQCGDDQAEMGA